MPTTFYLCLPCCSSSSKHLSGVILLWSTVMLKKKQKETTLHTKWNTHSCQKVKSYLVILTVKVRQFVPLSITESITLLSKVSLWYCLIHCKSFWIRFVSSKQNVRLCNNMGVVFCLRLHRGMCLETLTESSVCKEYLYCACGKKSTAFRKKNPAVCFHNKPSVTQWTRPPTLWLFSRLNFTPRSTKYWSAFCFNKTYLSFTYILSTLSAASI